MSLNIHKDDLLRQGSLIGEKIGFEKGRRDGLAKGAYQKALETAQTMKSMQYPLADIHAESLPHCFHPPRSILDKRKSFMHYECINM